MISPHLSAVDFAFVAARQERDPRFDADRMRPVHPKSRRPCMTTLLHIDSSARPGRSDRDARGSHTRRLTARFVDRWRAARPADPVIYRDVGAAPPSPVTGDWIHAAFTPPERR